MSIIRASGPPHTALITDGADGQGRSALAAVRALARGGIRPTVTTSGPPSESLAASSRLCSGSIAVPPGDNDDYRSVLLDLAGDGRWGWIVPASDAAVLALLPGHDRFVDKAVWGARAEAAGFAVPPTVHADSIAALRQADLPFPLVLKPTVARTPAQRIESAARLATVQVAGPVLAQPFLDDGLRSVSAVIVAGQLVAAVHQRYIRTWPVPCGTSSLAVTVPPDQATERSLLQLLDGFEGIVQIQLAGPYLLDVNARVYGSLPLAVRAGANLPILAIQALDGPADQAVVRARVGVVYRWIEGDLRNLARGMTSRSPTATLAALLPHLGAANSVWSATDPRPALTRLRVAGGRGRSARRAGTP